MSATLSATTAGNIHPGDLSPNVLITFDAFGWLLPDGLTRRKFERLARLGNAPAGVRYTPRSKMVWKAGGIAAWINAKEAAMDVAAETPAMSIAVVDENALGVEPAPRKALILSGKVRMEAAK